jgi:hypothetical protein
MRRLALALTFAVLAPLAAHAQSVVGKWDVQMNTPIGPRPFTVELKADGDSLSGGVKNENGEYAVRGAVKEQTVTFWYTIEYGGNPMTLTFVGTFTGDAMKGNVDFGGAAQDVFEAKRAAATPPAAPPRER